MIALVYDTETVDKPKRFGADPLDTDNWPRVLQLAWATVDLDAAQVLEQRSSLIWLPSDVQIHPEAQAVHGISKDLLHRHGNDLDEELSQFAEAMSHANLAACHNVGFDRPVMASESVRSGVGDWATEVIISKPHFCTMQAGTPLCKLPGRYGHKWPRLVELHEHLLGCDFSGAHDAMADVMACVRCLTELHRLGLTAEGCAGHC